MKAMKILMIRRADSNFSNSKRTVQRHVGDELRESDRAYFISIPFILFKP